MPPPTHLLQDIPLAPRTTLGVGGGARFFLEARRADELAEAAAWARGEGLEVFVLGGGSNLLVADEGFAGVVLVPAMDELSFGAEGDEGLVRAGAGVEWDRVVEEAAVRGWAGIECLSGIPGHAGAAPIQNIGAYGQELDETVEAVEAVDLGSGETVRLLAADCGFGYRTSAFKGEWRGRFAVTAVELRLRPEGAGTVRYRDLEALFPTGGPEPSPAAVRAAVIEVRRSKSMVIEAGDPNRRSAGSFFVNPVLSTEQAEAVVERVAEASGAAAAVTMPRFPSGDGRVKLSAAWLIEAAGFRRGFEDGPVGLSSRHALALINRGGARAADIVAFAARIRGAVRERFGVTLSPEPYFLGFDRSVDELLG